MTQGHLRAAFSAAAFAASAAAACCYKFESLFTRTQNFDIGVRTHLNTERNMQLRGANAASLVSLVPKASAFLRIPGGALSLAAPNTKPAYVPWDGLYIEPTLPM